MNSNLNKLVLTLSVLTTLGTASLLKANPEENVKVSLLSDSAFSQFFAKKDNPCLQSFLANKKSSQIQKVEKDYDSYLSYEASEEEIITLANSCSTFDPYYEISINKEASSDTAGFRLRQLNYVENPIEDIYKFNIYSKPMNKKEFYSLISKIRQSQSAKVKVTNLKSMTIKEYFGMVTAKTSQAPETVVASLEKRLEERISECQGMSGFCDDTSFSIALSWSFNQFLSYSIIESLEGAKYDSQISYIVDIKGSSVTPIKDIRNIFSESSLLTALKNDWIIRNSNKWPSFAQANSWDSFWDFQQTGYANEEASSFQSYSNRIKGSQIDIVRKCAEAAGLVKNQAAGYACIKNANLKKAKIYFFNYQVRKSTLEKEFRISKMTNSAVYVNIPLQSDATGSAELNLALPVNEKVDSFHAFAP